MYNLLTNLPVIEASSFVASPTAGLSIEQFGAEVNRADRIGAGPDLRRWHVQTGNTSLYWEKINRAKKPRALTLTRHERHEYILAMVHATVTLFTHFPTTN